MSETTFSPVLQNLIPPRVRDGAKVKHIVVTGDVAALADEMANAYETKRATIVSALIRKAHGETFPPTATE